MKLVVVVFLMELQIVLQESLQHKKCWFGIMLVTIEKLWREAMIMDQTFFMEQDRFPEIDDLYTFFTLPPLVIPNVIIIVTMI